MSQRSARPGMGAPVIGSLRANPSNKPLVTRRSSIPVANAGSSVSGSGPLIMTMSAGGSGRVQAASVSRTEADTMHRHRVPGKATRARGTMLMNDYLFVPAGVFGAAGAGVCTGGRLEINDIPALGAGAVEGDALGTVAGAAPFDKASCNASPLDF